MIQETSLIPLLSPLLRGDIIATGFQEISTRGSLLTQLSSEIGYPVESPSILWVEDLTGSNGDST